MTLPAVHLTGGESLAWAVDEDLRLLRSALEGSVRFVSLDAARIVHSVWWHRLIRIPPRRLAGRHILCYADNAPFHYITQASFVRARALVDTWIGRSTEAVRQFAALGIEARFAPYTVDVGLFRPLSPGDPAVAAARARWGIPANVLLVANFHRDTDGRDLGSPKLQKGPDRFVEALRLLRADGLPVHALLAGPRRHWIRSALARAGVPFTFVGRVVEGRDDMRENVLDRAELNVLYNVGAIYLVTSRWEGGPHSILEAAAAGCPIASTRVGIAEDVLSADCLFDTAEEAAALLAREVRDGVLGARTAQHLERVAKAHTEAVLRDRLLRIYETIPASGPVARERRTPFAEVRDQPLAYTLDRMRRRLAPPRTVVLVHPAQAAMGEAVRHAVRAAGLRLEPDVRRARFAVVLSHGDELPPGAVDLPATVRRRIHWAGGEPDLRGEAGARLIEWNRGAWSTIVPSVEALTSAVAAGVNWSHPVVASSDPEGVASRVVALLIS